MSENVSYDKAAVTLRLNAARVVASERQPYLSIALFSMVPVLVEGLGTMASDNKWRLYYDPKTIMGWSVEELAGVLLHEVGHCIRGHSERFQSMLGEPKRYGKIFNIAGDSVINADLKESNIPLPEGAVYVDTLVADGYDVSRTMSAEQIYVVIKEKVEKDSCSCGDNSSKDKEEKSENSDNSSGGNSPKSEKAEKGDSSDSSEQGEGENPSSKGQEGSQGQPADQSGSAGQPDPNCPVHGTPKSWDCGSGADGIARDYEIEGDKVDAGIDSDRADIIRQKVATDISNHSKNRGNVPAGLERWAKEILDPTVDWRRELASIVRRSFAQVAGIRDYTYSRPSRRDSSMRSSGQNIVLPAMRQPSPPKVSIVIDTSGSMSDEMLSWALSETQGVLRSLGSAGRSVKVISCDAKASIQKVSSLSQVNLSGGGGTDMRVGVDAAMQDSQKPDVIIVLTDGYTPWHKSPLKGTTLIVGLTEEGSKSSVPEWARVVHIAPEN